MPGKQSTHFFLHRTEWFFLFGKTTKTNGINYSESSSGKFVATMETGTRERLLLDSRCRSTMNLEIESISLQSHTESCIHCCGTQRSMEAYVYFWVHNNKMTKQRANAMVTLCRRILCFRENNAVSSKFSARQNTQALSFIMNFSKKNKFHTIYPFIIIIPFWLRDIGKDLLLLPKKICFMITFKV